MSQVKAQEMPLYVGLTTLPSRIGHIGPALDSLLAQSRPPDRIFLSLPAFSRREGVAYTVPSWLSDYAPLLEVVSGVDDDGPGTKLLGVADRAASAPCCLVIADDDMKYRPDFLEHLYKAQARNPRASFSYYTYPFGPVTVGQGADGFSFYGPNLAGLRSFAATALTCPPLRLVDDLWISGFLLRRGIAVRSLGALLSEGQTVYEETHSLHQLHDLNGDQARRVSMERGLDFMLMSGLLGNRARLLALTKAAVRGLVRRGASVPR